MEGIDSVLSNMEVVSDREADEIFQPIRQKNIVVAVAHKEKANELFRCKKFYESIDEYSLAIEFCPLDDESRVHLSTFFGNRAAAYASLSTAEHEQVIDDCIQSLLLQPDYVKVLMRRCHAFEGLGKIHEALEDAKKVQSLEPSYPKINDTVKKLEKESEEKLAKMKDEAIGKLKELGNSILGNFGMSLDNFKMNQDTSGSWSISMNNGTS